MGEKNTGNFAFYSPDRSTRAEWTRDALDYFIHELASQLLGRGFGTGEYSLEGAFVFDIEANTLTDIAPEAG